jgi:hypothetical protein
MELKLNIDVIINIFFFASGALAVYLTAYLKVKGKNKGLIEDINKLEDEKQKVIAKYRAETEEIKKQHNLDIEKRKFQYEDKRAQFSKYFAVLDEFHGKCNSIFMEEFKPIHSEFLNGYLVDDDLVQKQALVKFNEDIQGLMFKMHEELLKVKSEQHSIRLIASPTLDDLLDKLEDSVTKATDASTEMLRFMSTEDFMNNQTLVAPHQQKLVIIGEQVQISHDKLKDQMKIELNEI